MTTNSGRTDLWGTSHWQQRTLNELGINSYHNMWPEAFYPGERTHIQHQNKETESGSSCAIHMLCQKSMVLLSRTVSPHSWVSKGFMSIKLVLQSFKFSSNQNVYYTFIESTKVTHTSNNISQQQCIKTLNDLSHSSIRFIQEKFQNTEKAQNKIFLYIFLNISIISQ